jgi:methionine-rich copper-binding protein CopC
VKRKRAILVGLAALIALVAPAAASAHAYLTKTVPTASATLDTPPKSVQLTFSEPVEPRFAIISVTDKDAVSQVDGPIARSPADPDTLVVPL